MVVTFLAVTVSGFLAPVAAAEVVLASLIILLPGLTLTLALNELATGHLVSGTARFTGAMMTFLKIGLGVGLGQRLAMFLPLQPAGEPHAMLPAWTLWVCLLLTPWGLAVLFRARWREAVWIVPVTVAAFWGARLGVDLLGGGLGAVVGALLAGLLSNALARWRRRPAVVFIVPSILLLVPGSIGYRSLSLLLNQDVTSGLGNAFEGLLVGISLVAGLLLANVLLPPRNAL
jgi:uncharacterized membrane protein YjjB (DUF3815 family)